jgi:L-lactate dehydrogenase complex protein LldE
VPAGQTCCGQPALNSGDSRDARDIARLVIATFEGFDAVVAASGSCMGTLRHDYPALFADEPAWRARADALAQRSHELLSFLVDVLKVNQVDARFEGKVTYHDSCSGLREMGVRDQPRRLLASVKGLQLVEMRGTEECCGFGGTFCVKYPEISTRMVDAKIAHIEASGAGTVLGGDLGCLLNIAGRMKRRGVPVRVIHTAELLAGMGQQPSIGEPEKP